MTLAVLLVQAVLQGLVAHSVVSQSWWAGEWVRLQLRLQHPKAAYTQELPKPGWRDWVPSATTAVLVTAALVLLALLVVRVGRGWWLLAVAALPLVPYEMVPGTFAPPLPNQVAYALVWPAGASEPETTWAWVSAAITALLVALPAAAYLAVHQRRPWLSPGQVLGRLVPAGLGALAWLGWLAAADEHTDVFTASWHGLLFVVGAMTMTGLVRWWSLLWPLAVLPAVAAGAVRWTTGVDGVPSLALDPSALWMSFAALCGGLFAALVQPALVRAVRGWRAALRADVDARNAAREESVDAQDAVDAADAQDADDAEDSVGVEAEPVDDIPADVVAEPQPEVVQVAGPEEVVRFVLTDLEPVGASVSRRPSHAAPGRSGGRHRA